MLKNRFKTKIALIIIALLISIYTILALQPKTHYNEGQNIFMAEEDSPPHIIAHRGGQFEFPESTLEAMYNAYSVDPNVILEFDVAMTKDNVIILTHDLTLDRQTPLQNAYVHETNYSDLIEEKVDFAYDNPIPYDSFNEDHELRQFTNEEGQTVTPLDVDYPDGVEPRNDEIFLVTTFEEVIKAFPNQRMVVELKQSGDLGMEALDVMIDIMNRLDDEYQTFERIALATFHRDIFDAYMDLRENDYPQLLFSPQEDSVRKFYIMHRLRVTGLYRDPVAAFQIPMGEGGIDLTTERFIKDAQSHNIALHYWTINDEDDMRTLIELGVDGILTDRPSFLRTLIEEYYPNHYDNES